ncbi:MAG TPA: MqnA/MqnD/SBP family protein, partial [Bacillota bacterium]|nr:MqnA/MqnD/SBP family protein [Bacillota bacterium]
ADAGLLIGDAAMRADVLLKERGNPEDLYVVDLGESWKIFTGEAMVFAVWVIHKDFGSNEPEKVEEAIRALSESREWGYQNREHLIKVGQARSPEFSAEYLNKYMDTIQYSFDKNYRRALCLFFDYAYKSGLIPERVKIAVWGEDSANTTYTG